MADNTIGFGKIYDSTWWGIGVTTNTISWGKIYEDLANGSTPITEEYVSRVETDGGVIEAIECVNEADWNDNSLNWDYYLRVLNDNGIVESIECATI